MSELYELRAEAEDLKMKMVDLASQIVNVCEGHKQAKARLVVGMARHRSESRKTTVPQREDEATLQCLELIREEAKADGVAEGMKIQARLYDAASKITSSQLSSIKAEMEFTR